MQLQIMSLREQVFSIAAASAAHDRQLAKERAHEKAIRDKQMASRQKKIEAATNDAIKANRKKIINVLKTAPLQSTGVVAQSAGLSDYITRCCLKGMAANGIVERVIKRSTHHWRLKP